MKNEHVNFYREHFEDIQTVMIVIAENYFGSDTTASIEAVVKASKKLEGAIAKVAAITDDQKRYWYIRTITERCCHDVFQSKKKLPIVDPINSTRSKEEIIDGVYKDDDDPTETNKENPYKIDLRGDLKIAKLNKIQIQVINLTLDGYLLKEIAKEIGKTRHATSMIKKRAINLLKKYYGV